MPHRTYLTAPPGVEPTEATGRDATEPRERYVPGLGPVCEPQVPSRWRTPLVALGILAVLVAVIAGVVRASAASQAQDPSLFVPGSQQPEPTSRDGIPSLEGEMDREDDPDGGGLPGDG